MKTGLRQHRWPAAAVARGQHRVFRGGTGSVVKHYCLDRISPEPVQILPDEGTALMGDDATNGGLFLFVADVMDVKFADPKDPSHTQIPYGGAVYAHNLDGGQSDGTGAAIDSPWVPAHMAAVPELLGEGLDPADALGNLANPDNIRFSERLRTLCIGEDSGTYVNNVLWAFNVDSK